jgi:methionyl-tRNA formyltransferase
MKIVFFGTPEYCVPILNALDKAFSEKISKQAISAVVTQRPQPKGREKIITYSAVDKWAHKKKVEILYNPKEIIEKKIPATLGILVAYGAIIPPEVIAYFPGGILNIHPSLLPQLRGASPLQATIALGLKESGATVIKIDDKMDHGPIVTQFKEEVFPGDTSLDLGKRIFTKSIEVLIPAITPYLTGKIKPKVQDETLSSYTTLLTKECGYIPGNLITSAQLGNYQGLVWKIPFIKNHSEPLTPLVFYNFIRSVSPWPGMWTKVVIGKDTKRLKILEIHLDGEKLILDKVQLEGKNIVTWNEFVRGYPSFSFK